MSKEKKRGYRRYDVIDITTIAKFYVGEEGNTYEITAEAKDVPVGSMSHVMKRLKEYNSSLHKEVQEHIEDNRHRRHGKGKKK